MVQPVALKLQADADSYCSKQQEIKSSPRESDAIKTFEATAGIACILSCSKFFKLIYLFLIL